MSGRKARRPAAVRPPATRRARAERVEEILDAARALFCEKGYAQTAVSEIAARVGVVEGLVFKYFPSKRALLLEVLVHWYDTLFDDCSRELATLATPTERLRRVIERHLGAIAANPLLCRLMFLEVRSEHDYHGSALHARNRRYTELLVGVLAQGISDGSFRSDLPLPLLRDLVYGGIEHLSWNYLCGRGALDVDSLATQLVSLVLDGLRVPAAAPPATRRATRRPTTVVADSGVPRR
ncbi:MAG: TetR/AcrR family transcriptional regulator [Gammaproteobacteria bacterium]|nr:TetR/AcrR family transcriptional regulator [Gammaproteobacteria bacterium]